MVEFRTGYSSNTSLKRYLCEYFILHHRGMFYSVSRRVTSTVISAENFVLEHTAVLLWNVSFCSLLSGAYRFIIAEYLMPDIFLLPTFHYGVSHCVACYLPFTLLGFILLVCYFCQRITRL
jgi:hypothetical protein